MLDQVVTKVETEDDRYSINQREPCLSRNLVAVRASCSDLKRSGHGTAPNFSFAIRARSRRPGRTNEPTTYS